MKSAIVKRSIVISGYKTSVSLEGEFWQGLKEIVQGRQVTSTSDVHIGTYLLPSGSSSSTTSAPKCQDLPQIAAQPYRLWLCNKSSHHMRANAAISFETHPCPFFSNNPATLQN